MSKYVLYVDIGNLPKSKAEEYSKGVGQMTRESGFLNYSDFLLVLPRRNYPTELVKIE